MRLSPTPATPLHPPAASKDPQPPFCVFGSQMQQLIQCMWAILPVLSLSPSSVEFHHIAQRLQRGSGAPTDQRCPVPLGHNHMLRLFPSTYSHPHSGGLFAAIPAGKKTAQQPPGNSLSWRTAAGVPEALPDVKVQPGLGVKVGNTLPGCVSCCLGWIRALPPLFYLSIVPGEEKQNTGE